VAVLAATHPQAILVVLVAMEPLPLLMRRSRPTLTVALVVAVEVGLILAGVPSGAVGASVVAATYSAGAHQARRRSLGSLAIALLGMLALAALPAAGLTLVDLAGAFAVAAIAWWLGSSLRDRRYYAAELEQRTRALEAAQLVLAERAATTERLRLARELHDVVAHSLAIIALHSSVGAHNAKARPEDAVAALDAVNTAARAALAELRAMVMMLRDTDAETAPLPSLADLPSLIDQASRAGVTVGLSADGDVAAVPRAVSLSAYRIVQEALTNVVKHAGPVAADVAVTVQPGHVALTVTNRPPQVATSGPRPPGAGLAGMRERVAAFGGEFTAGVVPDGGWRVGATLMFGSSDDR
jgi:signal transduction histidine kinase